MTTIMTQITLPVPPLTFEELKAITLNELKKEGNTYKSTIRGLARLVGVSPSTLVDARKLKSGIPMSVLRRVAECSVDQLPETLKCIAGFDYRLCDGAKSPNSETNLLPLDVVQAVIKFYAYDAQKPHQRAKQLDAMLSSVGAHAFFDQIFSEQVVETAEVPFMDTSNLPTEPDLYIEDNPVDRALELIHKLESYRLRREEIVSFIENLGMLSSSTIRNTSYRGVRKHKNKWKAYISVEGTPRYLGSYPTPEDAALAYDSYAKVIYGNKAKLNF